MEKTLTDARENFAMHQLDKARSTKDWFRRIKIISDTEDPPAPDFIESINHLSSELQADEIARQISGRTEELTPICPTGYHIREPTEIPQD